MCVWVPQAVAVHVRVAMMAALTSGVAKLTVILLSPSRAVMDSGLALGAPTVKALEPSDRV